MHNTASGFYPQRFGDRIPTRGDTQSRGGRANLITSAQGKRVGSRVDNSLGRIKQQQINQQKVDVRGGTHYGNMFSEN